jgi:hypothetical protein
MSFQLRDSSGTVWDVTITTLGELQATPSSGAAADAGVEVAPSANDLIKSSMRLLGALGAGAEPSAEEKADALQALNWLLDSWNTEGFNVYATTRNSYTLTANTSSYTIGSGGTFNTTRPIRLQKASIIPNGYTSEYPLQILTTQQWQEQHDKSVATGTPNRLYYRPDAGIGTIYLLAIPDAAHTLMLYEESHLAQVSDGGSYLSLAPGYARALKYALAVEIAPEFGLSVTPEIAAIAIEAKASIQRVNSEPPMLKSDEALLINGGCVFDIYSGSLN